MKKMHLAIICLFTGCTIFAQNIDVQPIPQQVSKQDGQINLPETYQLLGETEANPYAVQELKDLLGGKHPANTGLRIYIGEKETSPSASLLVRSPTKRKVIIYPSIIRK